MKKTFGLLIILSFCNLYNLSFSQNQKDTKMLIYDILSTSDELYWNGDKYMVDKSFLSTFKSYKELYLSLGEVYVSVLYGTGSSLGDINYYPIWLLHDSVLYLRDIRFSADSASLKKKFRNGKQYKQMEKLTQRKFVPDSDSLKSMLPKSGMFGSIRADWVDGEFYIKKPRVVEKSYEEGIDEWERAPFQKLIFKKGKLVSTQAVIPDK